ncbi:MAG: class I SAM-dependent DNA methyltransferase, partial [Deltaproteobacteria bacterium]|nr:class I SAM-dependent DNA methyltransferase [Deltaproteobacteria bacterium]
IERRTRDPLSVYGREETPKEPPTTISQKDKIYSLLYKSENLRLVGPYAKLKFALDYWCSLWFWPIEKADLLPARKDFLVDLSMILIGTTKLVSLTQGERQPNGAIQHLLFANDAERQVQDLDHKYQGLAVDLNALCADQPRLALACEIAKRQKFLHWELEFSDIFAERGGFDLILGNPPWIKMSWNETDVLADRAPLFAIRNYSASKTTQEREGALRDTATKKLYFAEYEEVTGTQNFLNSSQNYPLLKGQQTNLYKCFLPQAFQFTNDQGISALIHENGVYEDAHGGLLREALYSSLRKRFSFFNERKIFSDVADRKNFILNVYGPRLSDQVAFQSIVNLYDVATIEACYDPSIIGPLPLIKDERGQWNLKGHPDRLLNITQEELKIFSKLFDENEDWRTTLLPAIYSKSLLSILRTISNYPNKIANISSQIFYSRMWDESGAQKNNIIAKKTIFPSTALETIYSGPNIGLANPLFKCARAVCMIRSDYDVIDLESIAQSYRPRVKYTASSDLFSYVDKILKTPTGDKYTDSFRLFIRRRTNSAAERCLYPAILPKEVGHIDPIISLISKDSLSIIAGSMSSIVYDFLVKISNKSTIDRFLIDKMPLLADNQLTKSIVLRALSLNCLTEDYAELWAQEWRDSFATEEWSKKDPRLASERFTSLTPKWTSKAPLRTDFERRQALMEIDVLTALELGLTLDQLKTIYQIQFPVLRRNENNTWYDQLGRITFTTNQGLNDVGFSRPEWEKIKDAKSGSFARTIKDDTKPGGPVKRTIEYRAPFDRLDREDDYETAWLFFSKKFGKG